MAMLVSWWERRDSADRNAFGKAALDFCRATRVRPGMRSSRFYWLNADTVVVANDGEMESFDGPPSPEQAKALFALSDLGRQTAMQRWGDAGAGEQVYRSAMER